MKVATPVLCEIFTSVDNDLLYYYSVLRNMSI